MSELNPHPNVCVVRDLRRDEAAAYVTRQIQCSMLPPIPRKTGDLGRWPAVQAGW